VTDAKWQPCSEKKTLQAKNYSYNRLRRYKFVAYMNNSGGLFRVPAQISRGRMIAVLAVAVIADALQALLVPFAWTFAQSAVDVVAFVIILSLIGFHPLLLPTFLIELVPVLDALPTWTACVAAVLALHRRSESGIGTTTIVEVPPVERPPVNPPLLPPPTPPPPHGVPPKI
jgi:hypothetical protein